MGTGELTRRVEIDDADLGLGAVVTSTGRVSVARRLTRDEQPVLPFTPSQLARLDEALTLAGRSTGLDFSIYLGGLGENSRARAEELHASIGSAARDAVLIAVSPAGRVVELVTGSEAARRVPNRGCKLAVMSMVASFKEGDLVGGLLSGLRMLSDQAGSEPDR
ncbi:hypothetical protein FHR81_001400 [Actinoalloteichus hoggarensis]|uniref:Uncharacterized protein n=1 Tax=Actinoalloteichus hoggarensis TaxID=1470176 RepID=A0A221W052_9PSEU|nr:DUF5130 family protein [Actinoalloteichus hoggarensis]ASO19134.1 hypothetical protein AHOG_07435 [Actinoalloteichus hoggarensis]MBB5920370.1 hypothetical protein [Actinoalloteichus hoggarensis]